MEMLLTVMFKINITFDSIENFKCTEQYKFILPNSSVRVRSRRLSPLLLMALVIVLAPDSELEVSDTPGSNYEASVFEGNIA